MRSLSAADPVRRAVSRWFTDFAPSGPVVVAVSGGADSLALAAAVRAETASGISVGSGGADRRVTAVTVDHQLQPGSATQAARCADQLRRLGFDDVRVVPVTVATSGGMEAAARRARQQALREVAAELGAGRPCPVLFGHTLDDQAETVLLGLARGSGPRSIAGMRRWRAPWGRPLLELRRSETENACSAVGLTPWTDPHNLDPAFTRVRLRAEVVPLLEDVLGGGVAEALARTADLLADDLAALDELAAGLLASAADDGGVDRSRLIDHPAGLRRRVLRSWLAAQGVSGLTADHLYRVDALLAAGRGAVRLPGGRDVIATADGVELTDR